MMNTRLDLEKMEPAAYKIMLDFEKYMGKSDVTTTHKNLIKIRASQLNGCSYCVDMHTKEAREDGETEQRLYLLSTWRETTFFTPEEQCVLAVAEEVTFISQRLSDATYQKAAAVLGEKYLAQVIIAVIIINAWNRIGVATNMIPTAVAEYQS